MRHILTAPMLMAFYASTAYGATQQIGGNWYGKAVEQIIYTHWGQAGTYRRVTDMSDGQCKMEEVSYSGGMSPLNEEVSWHFRGPMHLKQFAFYTPGSSSGTKRDLRPSLLERRHEHLHHERKLGDLITATINGQVVTWINEYGGGRASPSAAVLAGVSATASSPVLATKAPSPAVNAGAGHWGRQAYYNARNKTADGLVFLNNMGGQGSGVFDNIMGNSLSFASADATHGSASPQILDDILIDDQNEIIIYSDKPCEGNSCGGYRPGSVAYHGFNGETKLFLIEFDMPISGKTGWNMDMPAAWMLNAAIPRTQQYGDCSCWKSGCGEWDIFEVLDSGNTRAKSTLHAGRVSGGESDYFERPVETTMKAAIIFDGVASSGHIIVLPDDTSFDTVLADQVVTAYGRNHLIGDLTKTFRLGSFTP